MPGTSATERLAGRLRGQLIQPGDQEYDEARSVWNGMVDRRPAAVVRCAGTADVIAAVDCARSQDLGLTVRSGGHDVAGNSVCDGGLVIDVSELGDVRVDPAARLVRVGGGATWGVVDHETQAFGLAVTGAVDSRTGVAGFTLGGGVGYLARSLGLTSDNVVSAELVLADGRRVTADDRDHADLAWALRGGRGRLGVVTSLELRLHEVGPEVMTAQVLHGMEEAADVLAFYRDTMQYAPNEVSCYAQFMSVPSGEPLRDARPGAASLALVACHAGLLDEGRRALEPLRGVRSPVGRQGRSDAVRASPAKLRSGRLRWALLWEDAHARVALRRRDRHGRRPGRSAPGRALEGVLRADGRRHCARRPVGDRVAAPSGGFRAPHRVGVGRAGG